MSMEMTVQPLNLTAVVFNKEEMRAAIAEINSRYDGLVVTDKAEAKKDRAEVNRLLKQIDDARKAVKKQYEAPLKAFEADIKELVEPLKRSGDAIDAQIKQIEAQERMERADALKDAFNATGEHLYPFARILDQSWLNASTPLKKAVEALTKRVEDADAEITAIRMLQSPNEVALIDRWLEGASVTEVITYHNQLDAQAQVFKIRGAETPQDIADQLAQENPRNEYKVTDTGIQVAAKPTVHHIMISCTDAQFAQALDALDKLGIFFVVE